MDNPERCVSDSQHTRRAAGRGWCCIIDHSPPLITQLGIALLLPTLSFLGKAFHFLIVSENEHCTIWQISLALMGGLDSGFTRCPSRCVTDKSFMNCERCYCLIDYFHTLFHWDSGIYCKLLNASFIQKLRYTRNKYLPLPKWTICLLNLLYGTTALEGLLYPNSILVTLIFLFVKILLEHEFHNSFLF